MDAAGVLVGAACVEEDGVEVGAGVEVGVADDDGGSVVLELAGGVVEAELGEEVEGVEVELAAPPVDEALLSLPVTLTEASARRPRKFCRKAASATQSAATRTSRKRGEYMVTDPTVLHYKSSVFAVSEDV